MKKCDLCGNKLTLYKLKFKDGAICSKCIVKYNFGNKLGVKSKITFWAQEHTVEDAKALINRNENIQDINLDNYTFSKVVQRDTDKKLAQNKSNNESLDFHKTVLDGYIDKSKNKLEKLDIPDTLKDQLIESKSFDFWNVQKELKYLPQVIDLNNEKIQYACSGILDGHTWLIICTNIRIIFLNKNIIYGMQQQVIPLDAINAVTFTQKLALGSISITNGATVTTIESINKTAAPIMAQKIQAMQKESKNPSNTANYNNLRELKSLLDDGIITEEDFETKKKQILNI